MEKGWLGMGKMPHTANFLDGISIRRMEYFWMAVRVMKIDDNFPRCQSSATKFQVDLTIGIATIYLLLGILLKYSF